LKSNQEAAQVRLGQENEMHAERQEQAKKIDEQVLQSQDRVKKEWNKLNEEALHEKDPVKKQVLETTAKEVLARENNILSKLNTQAGDLILLTPERLKKDFVEGHTITKGLVATNGGLEKLDNMVFGSKYGRGASK